MEVVNIKEKVGNAEENKIYLFINVMVNNSCFHCGKMKLERDF